MHDVAAQVSSGIFLDKRCRFTREERNHRYNEECLLALCHIEAFLTETALVGYARLRRRFRE